MSLALSSCTTNGASIIILVRSRAIRSCGRLLFLHSCQDYCSAVTSCSHNICCLIVSKGNFLLWKFFLLTFPWTGAWLPSVTSPLLHERLFFLQRAHQACLQLSNFHTKQLHWEITFLKSLTPEQARSSFCILENQPRVLFGGLSELSVSFRIEFSWPSCPPLWEIIIFMYFCTLFFNNDFPVLPLGLFTWFSYFFIQALSLAALSTNTNSATISIVTACRSDFSTAGLTPVQTKILACLSSIS